MLPSFQGAFVELAGVHALVVVVPPEVVADTHEADLHVLGFAMRHRRPTVLVAFDARGAPTYHGKAELVAALRRHAAIAYRRHAQAPEVAPIDRVGAFQRVTDVEEPADHWLADDGSRGPKEAQSHVGHR